MYTSDILILALGGTMIMAGELKVGELTGFMSYVLQIDELPHDDLERLSAHDACAYECPSRG